MKPNSKQQQLDNEYEFNHVERIRASIAHPDITLTDDFKLKVIRLDARSDEAQWLEIDLTSYWLPANSVYAEPQPLIRRPALAGTIVLVIDKYFQRARQSKSRHRRAAFMVTTLIKLFERMWLEDIYELASISQADFDKLAKSLAHGGWQEALSFRRRLVTALDVGGHALAEKLLSPGSYHQRWIVPEAIKRNLGSNLMARELAYYHPTILRAYKGTLNEFAKKALEKSDVTPGGMGYSLLRQTFETINFILDLPNEYGISFIPYSEPARLAKRLGRPQSRTRNLGAVEAGLLLAEAYKWLYVYGPTTRELLAGLCEQVAGAHSDGREVRGYNLEKWLEASQVRRRLEEQLGVEITGVDHGSPSTLSVRKALLCIFSACFVLIATMNARRRDEITHRKFGLHRGFTAVEDELLGIYKGTFYIEKTYQDYLDFYVNRTTRDAALLLESIQDIFDELNRQMGRPLLRESPKREQSLFGYHRFSRIGGVNETRCWFNFESAKDGPTSEFLKRALGKDYLIGPNPHMFRRMYALVLMYQHEIPSLQAVSQQLGHDSLSTTQIYVTDNATREEMERIGAKIDRTGRMRSKIFASHVAGIRKEINLVSDEKLIETILSIIGGQGTSGGYPKYIKRFYRIVQKSIDLSQLDLERQAKVVASAVKKRGQYPNPMRHGQCMVGTQSPAHAAKCRGENPQPQPHNAAPHTCGKCPFHFISDAYVRNLEVDLGQLLASSADQNLSSIQRERANIDAKNLEAIIGHHRKRMEPLKARA